MEWLKATLEPIRSNRRAYRAINLAYYGLILVTMAVTAALPGVRDGLLASVRESLASGGLSPIAEIYGSRSLLPIVAVTLAANLFVGSLATITFPSAIVPFSGLALGGVRAAAWGVLFSPDLSGLTAAKIGAGAFIAGLLFLEGQGYVLAMLAAWLQGRAVLRPDRVGASSLWPAYRRSLGITLCIYVWVVLVLLVAAVYEAAGTIWILPALG